MGTYVYVGEDDNWKETMNRKCGCGHTLGNHSFTMKTLSDGSCVLYVSECAFCKYDEEKKEFLCREFHWEK